MPTHLILSIHLGPCLDQHPAYGLVAILGSVMERVVLGLQLGEDALEVERGVAWKRGAKYRKLTEAATG